MNNNVTITKLLFIFPSRQLKLSFFQNCSAFFFIVLPVKISYFFKEKLASLQQVPTLPFTERVLLSFCLVFI